MDEKQEIERAITARFPLCLGFRTAIEQVDATTYMLKVDLGFEKSDPLIADHKMCAALCDDLRGVVRKSVRGGFGRRIAESLNIRVMLAFYAIGDGDVKPTT